MTKCYLWNKCKKEHETANRKFTDKLFFVGRLFEHPICGHCILRLSRLTEPTPTDLSVNEMEAFKVKHPEYAALVNELGIDKIRFELRCKMTEANPNGLPVRPEQVNYPPIEASRWIRR
jgi:hypothetical protein